MTDRKQRPDFHALTTVQVLEALGVSGKGLSSGEAAHRLAKYGPNRLPEPPGRNPVLRFLSHFHNVLIYVLLGAALVTATLQHWVDSRGQKVGRKTTRYPSKRSGNASQWMPAGGIKDHPTQGYHQYISCVGSSVADDAYHDHHRRQ